MAPLKALSKQPKTTTLPVRLEEAFRHTLDRYAKFIEANPSYVVGDALRLLFRKDTAFKHWAGRNTYDPKYGQDEGDALTKTA